MCGAGSFQSNWNATVCDDCAAGSYQSLNGQNGASGEAIGDDDDGDASQVRDAGRGVGGAARDDGEVGVSDDDVGGDDGDAGGRGGGGAATRGVAAWRRCEVTTWAATGATTTTV